MCVVHIYSPALTYKQFNLNGEYPSVTFVCLRET